MEYLLLLVGFVLLVKGADFFVEGSSSLAKIMKVPSVIIGLTIVAMGTSAPEASVSINAALTGNNDIAISNVVGSNIFNGLVVVGICAFLASFKTNLDILKRDMPLNIVITMILCFMFMDGKLSRIEGLILLAGMAAYIVSMIYSALKNRETGEDCKVLSLPKSIVFMAGGLVAVIFGGDLVVDNACVIAANFGVSQNFIGLTIIAIGTSLPELVTSIVATRKGDSGLALGNAIGSNIFNILSSEFAASLNSIGISYKVGYSVAIALRYIPDIQRDYHSISQAQQARGVELGRKEPFFKRLKNSVNILLPLILTSLNRIDTISNAMELRGFGKKNKRTWYTQRPFVRCDLIALGVGVLLLFLSLTVTIRFGRFYNPFV